MCPLWELEAKDGPVWTVPTEGQFGGGSPPSRAPTPAPSGVRTQTLVGARDSPLGLGSRGQGSGGRQREGVGCGGGAGRS